MTEQFTNYSPTTLSAPIDNAVTAIPVVAGGVFASTGTFRIRIDDEIMLVTARSGNTLTATRGQEGTSAASHSGGANVSAILTAAAIAQLKADLLAQLAPAVVQKSANYTAVAGDRISVTGASGNVTILLPSGPASGDRVRVSDTDGMVPGTHTLTVDGNGKNINGAATYVYTAPRESETFEYNGTSWEMV